MPTITLTDPVTFTTVASGLIATNNANLRALLNSGLDYVNLKGNPQLVAKEFPVWDGAQFVRSSSGLIYQAFSPIWASSGTQPVIGNGTLVGRYIQIGKHIHFIIEFVAGTTTTFGTGNFSFSLPVAGATAVNVPIGTVFGWDNSASFMQAGIVVISSSTTMSMQFPNAWPTGTQGIYTATSPWTWAVSDFIRLSGAYEAA